MNRVPTNPDELDLFVERMLNDTGFFARHVLELDTDRGTEGIPASEVGKGGIRDSGKHQQMVAFVDDFSIKLKVLLAPRKSYKSSLVEALIARVLLRHPNWCILLMMHDFDMAKQRCTVIRDLLRNHEVVQKFFGDIKGPKWRAEEFTTSLRTDHTLLDPSLKAASPAKMPTGGHYHLIVLDDIIDLNSVVTPESVAKAVNAARYVMGLRARGAVVLDVGTPYAEGDVHDFLLENPSWKKLVLPVESEVVQLDDGRVECRGDSGWPHFTPLFLKEHLDMGYSYFMSQFKLKVTGGVHQPFRRAQFIPEKWTDAHKNLTGYLLTDVATGDSTVGALNVLAYVGLDDKLRLHILDLQIGHWPVGDFCDRLLAMKARWSGIVNHQAELLEVSTANNSYKAQLMMKSREKGIRLNLVPLPRGTGILGKTQRIMCLQARFQAMEVFVVDTVPKTWVDESQVKVLWDPEGYRDHDTDQVLPDGELVDQFIRFHQNYVGRVDIPDAIACIDSLDKSTGQRVCFYRKPSRDVLPAAIVRKPVVAQGKGRGTMASFYERAARRLGSK